MNTDAGEKKKGLEQELIELINDNKSKNGVYEKIDGQWMFRKAESNNVLDELRELR